MQTAQAAAPAPRAPRPACHAGTAGRGGGRRLRRLVAGRVARRCVRRDCALATVAGALAPGDAAPHPAAPGTGARGAGDGGSCLGACCGQGAAAHGLARGTSGGPGCPAPRARPGGLRQLPRAWIFLPLGAPACWVRGVRPQQRCRVPVSTPLARGLKGGGGALTARAPATIRARTPAQHLSQRTLCESPLRLTPSPVRSPVAQTVRCGLAAATPRGPTLARPDGGSIAMRRLEPPRWPRFRAVGARGRTGALTARPSPAPTPRPPGCVSRCLWPSWPSWPARAPRLVSGPRASGVSRAGDWGPPAGGRAAGAAAPGRFWVLLGTRCAGRQRAGGPACCCHCVNAPDRCPVLGSHGRRGPGGT